MQLTRRELLAGAAATATVTGRNWTAPELAYGRQPGDRRPKRVAAAITAYRRGLHADVLIGKILEGWKQDGGPGPALELASMYVEQFPEGDLSRAMSDRYGVPIFDSIRDSITLGGNGVAVDGVISVGEHGNYPWNDKQQHLYPRRRFFDAIADTFEKHDTVVPVFNDKHLGPVWSDAQWMMERARRLEIPFMAGSSLPVSFRSPELDLPMDCEIESAVGVGYSGLDIYGSHTLECFQCLVERRRGGETGVRSVQFLEGDTMWNAVDQGKIRQDLLDAALAVTPKQDDRQQLRQSKNASLFLFEYNDGLLGAVFMLPRYAAGISAAVKLKDRPQPLAAWFEERTEPRHPHFAYLLKAIERMMHSGRPSYPVERTWLTSGILDRALTSRSEGQAKLQTPELAIAYQPADYPHAPRPDLASDPVAALG